MFSDFFYRKKATLQIHPGSKKWIEDHFQWLLNEFGLEKFRSIALSLPDKAHFPEFFGAKKLPVRLLLNKLCKTMEIDPEKIVFRSFAPVYTENTETRQRSILGTYQKDEEGNFIISISTNGLKSLEGTIATLAHELSHIKLLGENRLEQSNPEHEFLTDLATVFFGYGFFTTNDSKRGGLIYYSSSGYLRADEFSYALALFCYLKKIDPKKWAKYLNQDIRVYFTCNLNYLNKTKDCSIIL